MRKYWYLKASIVSLAVCTGFPASAAPTAFQASYSVEKSGLKLGDMQSTLSYTSNQYTYLKQVKANGLAALISGDSVTERSNGLRQGVNLRSQNYSYHHKSKRKDRRDEFKFTTAAQVTGRFENQNYQLAVPQTTIDPALVELRLMEDIAANRPLNYQVTEKGKLKQYQFKRLGREKVSVPAGEFNAEKIQMARDDNERETILWLAPELNYVPVQIRHNEKGDIIDSRLTQYQTQ